MFISGIGKGTLYSTVRGIGNTALHGTRDWKYRTPRYEGLEIPYSMVRGIGNSVLHGTCGEWEIRTKSMAKFPIGVAYTEHFVKAHCVRNTWCDGPSRKTRRTAFGSIVLYAQAAAGPL
jgi:hypothetical protein